MPRGAARATLSTRIARQSDRDRRRIERALHDGPQQRLVALRIRLDLLLETVELDPHLGAEELQRLGTQLDEALEELRAIGAEVYPPLLAEAGLGVAVRAAAASARVPVDVEVGDLGRLAPELESAVYFAISDAMRAMVARDGAGPVVLRLDRDGDRVRFTIEDPGAAPCEGPVAGADRLAAVGGGAEASADGTTVTGWVPLQITLSG
jgi:signal transduction histidine kinase